MANMSYCRFQNTLRDLIDCDNNIDDQLSQAEHKARTRLIKLCQEIVDNCPEPEELPCESDDDEE